MAKRRKWFKIFLITVVCLVIVRLVLPFFVLVYANRTLATMNGYYGHIEDIDLAIIRGAYRIDSIYLNKVDSLSGKQTPFFSSAHADLSIEWRALLHGSLVGEVVLERPRLLFTKDKVEPEELVEDSSYFQTMLKKTMPFEINRFEVVNGTIRYKDEGSKPPVDIEMNNTYILAENLKNSYDSSSLLPAKIKASASIYHGTLNFNMKLNPLANKSTFDMNAELKNTNLIELNDFFQAYARVDVNKGAFGLYVEAAAKEGRLAGYVKPLIQDLDIVGKEDRKDNILQKLWEGLAGTVGQIFKNQDKDQVATKIPFEGKLENPNMSVWYAVLNVLRNAFVNALQPAIDNQINIASVENPEREKKTLLQKVFGKKKK